MLRLLQLPLLIWILKCVFFSSPASMWWGKEKIFANAIYYSVQNGSHNLSKSHIKRIDKHADSQLSAHTHTHTIWTVKSQRNLAKSPAHHQTITTDNCLLHSVCPSPFRSLSLDNHFFYHKNRYGHLTGRSACIHICPFTWGKKMCNDLEFYFIYWFDLARLGSQCQIQMNLRTRTKLTR